MPHKRASDVELDRIGEEQRKLARAFLTYVLDYPITDEDGGFIRACLLEAMGVGYRVEAACSPDRARFQVFAPSGVRIADRVLLARGMPACPLA